MVFGHFLLRLPLLDATHTPCNENLIFDRTIDAKQYRHTHTQKRTNKIKSMVSRKCETESEWEMDANETLKINLRFEVWNGILKDSFSSVCFFITLFQLALFLRDVFLSFDDTFWFFFSFSLYIAFICRLAHRENVHSNLPRLDRRLPLCTSNVYILWMIRFIFYAIRSHFSIEIIRWQSVNICCIGLHWKNCSSRWKKRGLSVL